VGTTAHGLPYPEGTDPVTDGAQAIEDLATALDDMIDGDNAGVTYATNAAAPGAGAAYVTRSGGVGFASLDVTTSAGFSSGVTFLTLPAGYRPFGTTRGVLFDATDGTVRMFVIGTDGTVHSSGLVSGHEFHGSAAFLLA
jgi:hypothetical protein